MDAINRLRRLLYTLRVYGFDPINFFRSIRSTPRYIHNLIEFKSHQKVKTRFSLSPALLDFADSAGSARGHYFWQDLIAAQWVNEQNPRNILDIGSRVDGYVAHVASFRQIDILDVRPLNVDIPNVRTILADAQGDISHLHNTYDLVSTLHALEHFGLGRYGDPLDPDGHVKGLLNASKCVKVGGHFILSFPVGANEIQFNSQRLLNVDWPLPYLSDFKMEKFILIPWSDSPVWNPELSSVDKDASGSAALYKFVKIR